jgi:class 3 adenylate cyclase
MAGPGVIGTAYSWLLPSSSNSRVVPSASAVEHGRYLASRIENAELIEVEGADHPYWAGNADDLLEPIERLLTGAARPRLATRVLTTVMFTDLVSSTQELERHGDVGWKRLLERHDAALLHLVGRFGGTYVNTTGDGMVATFDTPSRALGCAVAIRSAARQLALGVRIGLHTGEIELRDADITGIAVVVAARVVATASPGEILQGQVARGGPGYGRCSHRSSIAGPADNLIARGGDVDRSVVPEKA